VRLEDIGFYTLSDERALNTSSDKPLQRCELILTEACNFKCPYCRGITNPKAAGTIPFGLAEQWVSYWISQGLKNVRFTGGEPLLYEGLLRLVQACAGANMEHIAVSTNGSMSLDTYLELILSGANDFSISLDGGCCAAGEAMSGVTKKWDVVVDNIKALSELTYVTLGMVFTEENVDDCVEHVLYADSLGAADIRVIPSAQYNKALEKLDALPDEILDKYPILRYRIHNLRAGRSVRGLGRDDCRRCWLAFDDMACAQGHHFPCIIHLREGGEPIGPWSGEPRIRRAREEWVRTHDTFKDPICRENCLDVCVDYNNVAMKTHGG
jgi:MoaA/NifB/PqqE/SkfB family radical SAM enzyme